MITQARHWRRLEATDLHQVSPLSGLSLLSRDRDGYLCILHMDGEGGERMVALTNSSSGVSGFQLDSFMD